MLKIVEGIKSECCMSAVVLWVDTIIRDGKICEELSKNQEICSKCYRKLRDGNNL